MAGILFLTNIFYGTIWYFTQEYDWGDIVWEKWKTYSVLMVFSVVISGLVGGRLGTLRPR
jgi:hypothetical protein